MATLIICGDDGDYGGRSGVAIRSLRISEGYLFL